MQTETDNSGPAFPHDEKTHDGSHWFTHPGMTLRDYFAGQALAWLDADQGSYANAAREAYAVADALLTERAKGGR